MKNLMILFLFLSFLVSCSSDHVVDVQSPKMELDKTNAFISKLDSLNSVYSSMGYTLATRGYVSDYAISTAADGVGSFIGKRLFGWAGSAIGAACGNPIVAVGGYIVGRKFGSCAGSAVASIGAAWILDQLKTHAVCNTLFVLNEGYVVPIENPDNLSEGELHNLILEKLLRNFDNYVMIDGNLNDENLMEDAYKFENEISPCEEYDTYKAVYMPKSVEQIKRIVNSSVLLKESTDAFLNDVYNNLIPEIQITKKEFDNANILNEKMLSTYMVLDTTTMKNFYEDINKTIDCSNIDTELKVELKNSNSVLRNSTMLWREVQ